MNTKETISTDTIIGDYSVVSKIGEGGMGEVYRARDLKLGRDVAIKILPAAFSEDSARLARFEQEAQAAGSLNHPNILVIFHIGAHEGAPYIVSELLEGETLRERMAGGALPQRKAIDYALQIARGLAAAHEKGIVHRDIKPDNVFVTNDGRVKILDFGLAKLSGASEGLQSDTKAPTRKVNTDPGTVMGTMGYVSPEQLKGQPADHRSDIFSFGAILYEMLSGRRAFRGDSLAETMSAILREDPPGLSETNKTVSPALERVVHHCLEKNPAERFHSARDLAFAIESLSGAAPSSGQTMMMAAVTTETSSRQPAVLSPHFGNARLAWLVAAILLLVSLVSLPFAVKYLRQAPPAEPVTGSFTIAAPEQVATLIAPIISPDGRNLAFSAIVQGAGALWLRPIGSPNAHPLSGSDSLTGLHTWSPDSRSIVFPAAGKLKRIDLSGGAAQTLCSMPNWGLGDGATAWNSDGVILFTLNGKIYRVPATGGDPALVLGSDQLSPDAQYRWPAFLPDGRHFLYLRTPISQGASEIYLASLDDTENRRLLAADSHAVYTAPSTGGGYLLFARTGVLFAQSFDASGMKTTGEPFVVAEKVTISAIARAMFTVSDNGVLVYDSVGSLTNVQPNWVDRTGKQLGSVGDPGRIDAPRLSPDGKRVVLTRTDPQTRTDDIYVIDLARGTSSRLTFDPASDTWPIWSPDGNRVAWMSIREGTFEIFQKLASGVGQDEVLLKSEVISSPDNWSADGRLILYDRVGPQTKNDLWILPVDGDRQPFPYLQTPFDERRARFSPDGLSVAYDSDEQGRSDVYVQTFPVSGSKWQISNNGGAFSNWRGDGKELFYISSDNKMMAVDTKPGTAIEAGVPKALFDLTPLRVAANTNYAVTADGQRFLFITQVQAKASLQYNVVVNWAAEAKKSH